LENNLTYNLLETLLNVLEEQKTIPFYNQPIFLTLLSITLGGIAITLITKNIEHKSKRREMAINFLNDMGLKFSSILAVLTGHIKRKDYGEKISEKAIKLKGSLFSERFSVRVKSKAYLKNNDFWKKYDYLIYDIDILLYIMKSSNPSNYIDKIDERMKLLQEYWLITDIQLKENDSIFKKEKLEDIPNDDYHNKLTKWSNMIWIRANILIQESLEKII
jgi:hypothetical protein